MKYDVIMDDEFVYITCEETEESFKVKYNDLFIMLKTSVHLSRISSKIRKLHDEDSDDSVID